MKADTDQSKCSFKAVCLYQDLYRIASTTGLVHASCIEMYMFLELNKFATTHNPMCDNSPTFRILLQIFLFASHLILS